MKKLFTIMAIAIALSSCKAPQYIYDKAADEYVTSEEYYSRYPEESPDTVTLIITVR